MRKYVALLLVVLVALLGCGPTPPPLAVTLEAPGNSGSVSSLTPILAWTCTQTTASYRLQLATDSNFGNLVIDEATLAEPTYTVPSGKLTDGQTYYWKVNASREGQTSGWSNYWSFKTPTPPAATGTIVVNATLDGSPWSGEVSYTVTGPKENTSSSVPQTFSNLPVGAYAVSYHSGKPAGAKFANITPSQTQTLSPNDTPTFTLNFRTQATNTIVVNATLNGSSWSGQVSYTITGPKEDTGSFVSQTFSDLPDGNYAVSYRFGGPSGATLGSITPSPTGALSSGGTIIFTLNFHTHLTSAIRVNATLDGSAWSGEVRYTLTGPYVDSSSSVPDSFSDLPSGTYSIHYRSGGPSGATLVNITPSPTQNLSSGDIIIFTLNFRTPQPAGTIMVNATLDGSAWSGQVHYYTLHGPYTDSSSVVPDTFRDIPAGTYTLSYMSGGPSGATLVSITPSPTQNLSLGGIATFTMNFQTQAASGVIRVQATLDGRPWQTALGSGTINYTLYGPKTESSSSVPENFNCPSGTYTLSYRSGGPVGATFVNVTPASRQNLPSNGAITFTLNFHSQVRGTVLVNATLDGSPWQGEVRYTLTGPYVDSSSSVHETFRNCPAGTYAITYNSGGPHQSRLTSISPPRQNLPSGGTITFTLNFTFQGGVLK